MCEVQYKSCFVRCNLVTDTLDKLMVAAAKRVDYPKFLWRFVLADHAQVQEAHTQILFVCLHEQG
jgi:hypothetical protein